MYVVTGVSRGLGKAIALSLLNRGERVLGIGRTNSIEHPSYVFHSIDLSSEDSFDEISLNPNDSLTLINNAGILGQISRMTDMTNWDLDDVFKLNTSAPMKLAISLYQRLKDKNNFSLVNISSGAANKSIPSWAAYCASKAALNMLSENFFLEEREKGNYPKVFCVAPGVIDTAMQEYIRSSGPEKFSSHHRFIDLKENNQLFSPEECATRLLKLLDQPYDDKIFYDLRDL